MNKRKLLVTVAIAIIVLLSIPLLFSTTGAYIFSFSFSFALPILLGCAFPVPFYFAFGGRKSASFFKENNKINIKIKSINKLA